MRKTLQALWLSVLLASLVALQPPKILATPSVQTVTCSETYIVQANDWLSKIADKFLGDIEAYVVIVAATNRQEQADDTFARINNADAIKVGWKLCIPIKPEAEALLAQTQPAPGPVQVAEPASVPPIIATALYTLDDFAREFNFSAAVNPAWIYTSPDQPVKPAALSKYQEIERKFGYRANYLWNQNLDNSYFFNPGLFKVTPPEVTLYPAPWGTVVPRFRYPLNVTLPSGLSTNQFGWRGDQIALKKPKKTIRIATVGASTTVSGHTLPYSYPELLQHWLNLWSKEKGYDVTFEVINAGREGLSSNDIAAVVQYEVMPVDVDYVIYYEGANQFDVQTMVTYPADVTFGKPPAGLVPNLDNVDSEDKTLLDQLSEYSALASRARSIVEQFSVTGQEPPKPEQFFHLPEGLDEFNPNRTQVGNALALRKILGDLDQIKGNLDKREVKLVLATFDWFAYEGMVLDPTRHRNIYAYLNRVYWPITYANMRRMADFQNRVFKRWATDNRVEVIDVAGRMPRQPDLYDDAIHNRPLGIRIRAWINFEAMVPLLKQDIESGALPRRRQVFYAAHPYITPEHQTRSLISGETN